MTAALGLTGKGWWLQMPGFGGLVTDPVVVNDQRRPVTMTPTDIVHQRRVAAVTHAIEIDNVAETARCFGVSRKTIHAWKRLFETYGPEGLAPKQRRRPAQPNATPTWVVDEVVRLAVTEPGLGARRYADRLSTVGYSISKTTIQNLLNAHRLGRRQHRYAAAARLALFTKGLVTDAAIDTLNDDTERRDGPFGFCLWASRPATLVGIDCFYIGKLKGVGEVWQLTAVDTYTRIADVVIIRGRPTASHTIRFIDLIHKRWQQRGFDLQAVISDNGAEFVAHRFRTHLESMGVKHRRIPPRSPNHNAVVERFHQTILEDCWRPAFHRRLFNGRHQLQAQANAWLIDYHTRPNHGDWMNGRTPTSMLNNPTR
jgi:transposase InsO family protein